MKETTENTLKEWSPKGDQISFQDGMNGALHNNKFSKQGEASRKEAREK